MRRLELSPAVFHLGLGLEGIGDLDGAVALHLLDGESILLPLIIGEGLTVLGAPWQGRGLPGQASSGSSSATVGDPRGLHIGMVIWSVSVPPKLRKVMTATARAASLT